MSSDTGSGGLFESGGAARVEKVWYADRPQSPGEPYIQFSVDERPQSAGSGRVFFLTVYATIAGVPRIIGDESDFGHDRLLAIKKRLRDRMIAWVPTATGGITYTALSHIRPEPGQRGPQGERISDVEVFSLVASEGLTGGILTGETLRITGTLASGAGGIDTAHPFRVQVLQDQRQEAFVSLRRKFVRYMHGARSTQAVIGFIGQGGAAPYIPTGKYSTLTITLGSGAVYSGPAMMSSMSAGSAQDGSPVSGSYRVVFDGPMNQEYGVE